MTNRAARRIAIAAPALTLVFISLLSKSPLEGQQPLWLRGISWPPGGTSPYTPTAGAGPQRRLQKCATERAFHHAKFVHLTFSTGSGVHEPSGTAVLGASRRV